MDGDSFSSCHLLFLLISRHIFPMAETPAISAWGVWLLQCMVTIILSLAMHSLLKSPSSCDMMLNNIFHFYAISASLTYFHFDCCQQEIKNQDPWGRVLVVFLHPGGSPFWDNTSGFTISHHHLLSGSWHFSKVFLFFWVWRQSKGLGNSRWMKR